jgi:hypothetical protein
MSLDGFIAGPNETPDNPLGDDGSEAPITDHQRRRNRWGKIALTQHTSLDGVMQSPGPTDVPFKYRGWIVDFEAYPERERFNGDGVSGGPEIPRILGFQDARLPDAIAARLSISSSGVRLRADHPDVMPRGIDQSHVGGDSSCASSSPGCT